MEVSEAGVYLKEEISFGWEKVSKGCSAAVDKLSKLGLLSLGLLVSNSDGLLWELDPGLRFLQDSCCKFGKLRQDTIVLWVSCLASEVVKKFSLKENSFSLKTTCLDTYILPLELKPL